MNTLERKCTKSSSFDIYKDVVSNVWRHVFLTRKKSSWKKNAYLAKAFCNACLSVNFVAGIPPCSWIYLAHPRLPLNKAASRGVINWPLEFLIMGLTSDLWSISTANQKQYGKKRTKNNLTSILSSKEWMKRISAHWYSTLSPSSLTGCWKGSWPTQKIHGY